MKTNHAIILAAVCICLAGCRQSSEYPPVKSLALDYPTRDSFTEYYTYRYDSEGRLAKVEKNEVYEGEDHTMSWSYAYDAEELKAVSVIKGWVMSRTASVVFQDDFNHMLSYTLPEETEEDEYGIVFLGQTWEATYTDGRLTRAVLSDFTSDGMDIRTFKWDEDGLLVGYEGSDPGTFIEIKDVEYFDTHNPFVGPDPVALIMGMGSFYWQGFAGPRPASLVAGYTRVTSDPWCEDVSIDHVVLTYEVNLSGRISHIIQTVNGVEENVVKLTY